jgi:hypothetical protein
VIGFFQPGAAPDDRYRILRDDNLPLIVGAREFVERLRVETGPYLDPDPPVDARYNFQERFWETSPTHSLGNGPEGYFAFRRECWFDQGQLHMTDRAPSAWAAHTRA